MSSHGLFGREAQIVSAWFKGYRINAGDFSAMADTDRLLLCVRVHVAEVQAST